MRTTGDRGAKRLAAHQERWKWVGQAVESGQSLTETLALLRSLPSDSLPSWANGMDQSKLERKIEHDYRKHQRRGQDFARLAEQVERIDWPNTRAGATDVAVYLALLVCIKNSGGRPPELGGPPVQVSVSQRVLMELAGVGSRGTLNVSLGRLYAQELVWCITPLWTEDGPSNPTSIYNVGAPRGGTSVPDSGPALHSNCTTTPLKGVRVGNGSVDVQDEKAVLPTLEQRLHVVWTNQGFGSTGRRVWAALSLDTPQRVGALARSLGLHRNTVSRLLKRFETYGLAAHGQGGWTRLEADTVSLDCVAEDLGVSTWRERKAPVHEIERELFDQWRSARREHQAERLELPPNVDPSTGELLANPSADPVVLGAGARLAPSHGGVVYNDVTPPYVAATCSAELGEVRGPRSILHGQATAA